MSDSWSRSLSANPRALGGADRTSGVSPSESGEDSVRALLRQQYALTPREVQVALLLIEGLSYREIAEALQISFHTVNSHVTAVRSKTGVRSIRKLQALTRRSSS